uniref:Leucine-rich repeat protein n=1 Tax=viral metagenome TaxID=1070528 RepID=A0A6C0E1C2_9ZZZZ
MSDHEYDEFNEFNEFDTINVDNDILIKKALEECEYCDVKDMAFECLPIEMSQNKFIKRLDMSDSCVVSLINLPPNLEILIAENNDITEIDDSILPKSLKLINVKNNSVTKINLLNSHNLVKLLCENNPIKTFELPITLKICVISSQELNMKHFENMNELQILKISKSNIYNLELINPNIKQLLIHRSHIKCDLPKFSPDLYKLEIINSNISGMIDKFEFPKNLISLNLSDNKLSGTFVVPPSVIDLDISDNDITKLENIQNLQKLNIANNENIDMTDAQLAIIQHNQCNFIHNNGKYHKEEEYTQRQQEIHEMMMRHRQILAMTSRNSDSFRPSTANKIEIKKFCSV